MKKRKVLKILIIVSILILGVCTVCYGATDPTIMRNLNSALNKIKEWIVKISTPAAAIAVGTGTLMKKFSFGDEEKIIMGKKLIKNALFSYGMIIGIDLILKAIEQLVKP